MKAPKKNHQDAKLEKSILTIPKNTPITDFLRKVVFIAIVVGIFWWAYNAIFVRFEIERTAEEVYLLEKSIRDAKLDNGTYKEVASLKYLYYTNQLEPYMYDENNPLMGKNRFGGAIVVQPENGGFNFSIEYAGVPEGVCQMALGEAFMDETRVDSIRIGGRVFTWDGSSGYMLPISIDNLKSLCTVKNFKIIFK